MSNLYKTSYVNLNNKDKRVIDTNQIIEMKLAKMREEEERKKAASFVPGLVADEVDGEYIGEGAEGDFAGLEGILSDESVVEGSEDGFTPGIIKAAPVDTSAIIEAANAEAEGIIAQANEEASNIINDAMIQAQDEINAAMNEAREEGYASGAAEAEAQYQAKMAELAQMERDLSTQYQALFDEIEPQLVETITDIYQHIFSIDLSNHREILTHLISNTIRRIEGAKSFLVHVSPDDCAYVSMQKKLLEAASPIPDSIVEIIEDVSLGKSSCFIETDGGIFDCGLDTELTELTQKIRLLSYEKGQE